MVIMTTQVRREKEMDNDSDKGEVSPLEEIVGQSLVPQETKIVDFYGDQITVAIIREGQIYVLLRPIADALGLSFSSQRKRVLRDEAIADELINIKVDDRGQARAMLALPLELLPGFLFGISATQVAPHLRDRIILYRKQCFKVLWDSFKTEAVVPIIKSELSKAEMTLEMITAMQHLAEQQVEMERTIYDVAGRQQAMADYMRGFIQKTNSRLSVIELRLDPASSITDEQAAEIALAVKNVAHAMEGQGTSGGYGKVYSEMYRRYRISSYKNLPRAKYDEVIAWLSRWYDEVVGGKQGEEN